MPVLKSCYWERADMKPMRKEVKQRRWKMIGHILRQDQNSNCKIAITWAPEGKKKKSKTKNHLEANGWKGKGRSGMAIVAARVKTIAANWDKWRDAVKALCATRHEEYRCGEVRVQGFGASVGSFGWTSFSYDWSVVLKATKWSLRWKLVPIPLTVSGVANALNAQVYINEVRARFTCLALIHSQKNFHINSLRKWLEFFKRLSRRNSRPNFRLKKVGRIHKKDVDSFLKYYLKEKKPFLFMNCQQTGKRFEELLRRFKDVMCLGLKIR